MWIKQVVWFCFSQYGNNKLTPTSKLYDLVYKNGKVCYKMWLGLLSDHMSDQMSV